MKITKISLTEEEMDEILFMMNGMNDNQEDDE